MVMTVDNKSYIEKYVCILSDLETGKEVRIFEGHKEEIHSVDISADGKIAISGSRDKTCIIWDLETGQRISTLRGHSTFVYSVSFLPDGQRALSGSWDKTCVLWNLETGNEITRFFMHFFIYKIAYISPNKIFIYAGDSSPIFIQHVNKNQVSQTTFITTIRHIAKFKYIKFHEFVANCPTCGLRIKPKRKTIRTIRNIRKQYNIHCNDSPCLTLPKVVWKDHRLLSYCYMCGQKLKFNPFIVDDYEPKLKWKFWER